MMSDRKTYKSALLEEGYEKISHKSGLDIYIFPKDLTTTYAIFGVKYGSINNRFSTNALEEPITVPDGIAHFLEHKLFTNEDGSDSFERFSEYGADANAYTAFNKTAYLFSCTENFEDSLVELIRFVTHPYFTPESVKSEIGIISEEIKMYDDSPSDRCFYGMLEGMYESHSIKRNICGSVESISQITADTLYQCYNAFYSLSNMALIICGNVDVDAVLKIANNELPQTNKAFQTTTVNENDTESPCVFKSLVEQKMQVSKPMFSIGFKDTDISNDPIARLKKDAVMAILDEMIFSRAGALYDKLFNYSLISPNWSYGYTISSTAAYNSVAGESDDPKAVLEQIMNHVSNIKRDGLSMDDFIRSKRVLYADFVKSFDSTENIANNLLSFIFDGTDMFDYTDIITSITFEDVTKALISAFDEDKITLSIVNPL